MLLFSLLYIVKFDVYNLQILSINYGGGLEPVIRESENSRPTH